MNLKSQVSTRLRTTTIATTAAKDTIRVTASIFISLSDKASGRILPERPEELKAKAVTLMNLEGNFG
jgi:hypothetical protein